MENEPNMMHVHTLCAKPQGIHYREADRPQPPLYALQRGRTQSTSFHCVEDMQHEWGALTYAFFSPVFDSISKPGYVAAGFCSDALHAALPTLPFDVIALGGVTADNVLQAHAMGFAGVAVLGSIWSATSPVQAFDDLQKACWAIGPAR